MTAASSCACQSGASYVECCKPYHDGLAAPTALALMRSRYSAYVAHDIDYIINTTHPSTRDPGDRATAESWAVQSQWLGLKIIATQAGGCDDTEGVVEFVAQFEAGGRLNHHHERSLFRKADGKWHYLHAVPVETASPKRAAGAPGRNALCPCGTGKKYKRCHGV